MYTYHYREALIDKSKSKKACNVVPLGLKCGTHIYPRNAMSNAGFTGKTSKGKISKRKMSK